MKIKISIVLIIAAIFGIAVYAQQTRTDTSIVVVYQTCDGGIVTNAAGIQAAAESMRAQGCDTLHFKVGPSGQYYAYGKTAAIVAAGRQDPR